MDKCKTFNFFKNESQKIIFSCHTPKHCVILISLKKCLKTCFYQLYKCSCITSLMFTFQAFSNACLEKRRTVVDFEGCRLEPSHQPSQKYLLNVGSFRQSDEALYYHALGVSSVFTRHIQQNKSRRFDLQVRYCKN